MISFLKETLSGQGAKNYGHHLKPHCIQSSRVLVPAGTSKSTSRRHGIQAVIRVMAHIADAVKL
jgi:hypothetical protein